MFLDVICVASDMWYRYVLRMRHGSITFLPITVILQLHTIQQITITSIYSEAKYNNYNYRYIKQQLQLLSQHH